MRSLSITIVTLCCFVETAVGNTCLSLKQGPVTLDVLACKQLDTSNLRFSKDSRIEALKGLDRGGRAKIISDYKGQILEAKVVSSKIYDTQFPETKGAMLGEKLQVYLFPGDNLSCEQLEKKRLAGKMQQICCNGRLEAPCLLETQYTLESPKVVGGQESRAGDKQREKSARSKAYVAGLKAFQKKQFQKAAKLLEKARANKQIDLVGRYALGVAYRKLDSCPKAIPVLQEIYDEQLQKKNWADQSKYTRRGIFLLARCYSKELNSGQAVLILNSYLVQPQRYKTEIRESLKHPDFGWIHTTKDYREYRKNAQAKLR